MSEDAAVVAQPHNYEVPGEPGVYWCAKHQKVKTRLRCGRCERPICPKCTVYGPTGTRCRICASNKSSHIYQVTPLQYVLAVVTAVLLGSLSGFIAGIASFFALFYAPVAGTFIAKAVSAVSKHKRGTALAVIAIAGTVLGAFIPQFGVLLALWKAAQTPDVVFPDMAYLLTSNITNPFVWGYVVLAAPSIWYWLKS